MITIRKVSSDFLLASSIGLVYLWFGALKFFNGMSPAEELAGNTIDWLTLGLIPTDTSILLLALWETAVGLLLILNVYRKQVIIIALIHMVLTFTPFLIFSELSFNETPLVFTLLGQYIFKNIIIIAALVSLYTKRR